MPATAPRPIERLPLAALLCGAVAIAFAPIFFRWSETAPVATAFWRLALASPFLWLLARRETVARTTPATRGEVALVAGAGVFFAGDLIFWHWSLAWSSVANATLLANAAPVFVVIGGWLLYRRTATKLFLAGMATAMAGAAVLMDASLTLSETRLLGDVFGIVTAAFYGAYMLCIDRLGGRITTLGVMAWSTPVAALVCLPVALLSDGAFAPETLRGWAVLVGLALVAQAIGQTLVAHGLGRLPVHFGSVALLLQPATAALLAWVLLAEPMGAQQAAGAAVILAGILMARRGARAAEPR
ncbi:MAG: DMT family transporter [Rhodospirillales bacterium]